MHKKHVGKGKNQMLLAMTGVGDLHGAVHRKYSDVKSVESMDDRIQLVVNLTHTHTHKLFATCAASTAPERGQQVRHELRLALNVLCQLDCL